MTLAFEGRVERVELADAPSVQDLYTEYVDRGGSIYACPVCVKVRGLGESPLAAKAEIKGVPSVCEFADGGALVFNY